LQKTSPSMALSEMRVEAIFAAFQARVDSALWLFFVRSRFCVAFLFSPLEYHGA
jgi:hypothetical protein